MVILKLYYWMKSIFVFINLGKVFKRVFGVLHIQRKRLDIEETEARRRILVSDLLESRRLSFNGVDGFCFTTLTATALCVHGGHLLREDDASRATSARGFKWSRFGVQQ
ncbi:hypothetical protein DY000_02015036 [Brassica cretica]|uniref:Uncharacterized protein n=1 Tax=Brassica cretica TaxID=69181 RepID=A0ABQ7CR16_BRACR|nr:hypothetical protein DY000_02015036 [Brassica cretica]